MDKAQEMQHYNKFVENYPEDSYLKSWLVQVRYELERNLNSDFIPTISLNDAQKRAEKIIEEAEMRAKLIIANAKNTEVDAQKKIESMNDRVASVLRGALKNLNEC